MELGPHIVNQPDEEPEVYEIWTSRTGITDLPNDWKNLSIAGIRDIIPVWADSRKKLDNTDQLRIFNERLAREWAIETGVIEDVFHIDRGTTVTLIEQGLSAALIEHGSTDKPPEYVISILRDHVEALDWLVDSFVKSKQKLTTARIKELQSLLTAHQSHVDAYILEPGTGALVPTKVALLRGTWKQQPNNVERDGRQFRYCPPLHTEEEMTKLVDWHNGHQSQGVSPEVEAAWLHHRFTQIHPFHDGNGRVARALASLVFIQAGLFPLVINRDEMRGRYITALETADAGDLRPLIEVFAEAQQARFDRALNISDDLTQPAKSIELAVEALKARVSAKQDAVAAKQRTVFDLSRKLEALAIDRLEVVSGLLAPIEAHVTRSTPETSHYYRYQIIESARALNYYANTKAYASWVKLAIEGHDAAQLLLSFHGRGSEFIGVMVCTTAFELILPGSDDGAPRDRVQTQVTDRPFEFYFTEKVDDVQPRFLAWLDETIALSLSQFQKSL